MSIAFFLKLARIPVYFLILVRIFLTEKGHLYATLCSFYSKVTADGTELCDVSCFRGITANSLFGVEKVREHF